MFESHDWRSKPGLFREGSDEFFELVLSTGVQIELLPTEPSSRIFQHRFCANHPGEEVLEELSLAVFD